MKMADLPDGNIAIIIDKNCGWKGTIVVRASNVKNRFQMVGKADGFSDCSDAILSWEILDITSDVLEAVKGVVNATK